MLSSAAVIALLFASALAVLCLGLAMPFALQVVRRWDPASGSELQLRLERRTYLLSTLVAFVLALQTGALLLFIVNAEHMSVQFVGAMCAVGTLNANPFGFPTLLAQLALFFLAALWLILNHVDTRARDYPLVRLKYRLLMGLLPVVVAVLALQWQYFANLRPEVITSCCGSLFGTEAKGWAGELPSLAPGLAMAGFYGFGSLAMAAAFGYRRWRRGGYGVALASAGAFLAALAGIVSFLSLYVYEHPHHHCPFCLLKPEYSYQGYLLYLPLLAATAAGLGVGVLQPFRRIPSLSAVLPAFAARLAAVAAWSFFLFLVIASLMIARSRLLLFPS